MHNHYYCRFCETKPSGAPQEGQPKCHYCGRETETRTLAIRSAGSSLSYDQHASSPPIQAPPPSPEYKASQSGTRTADETEEVSQLPLNPASSPRSNKPSPPEASDIAPSTTADASQPEPKQSLQPNPNLPLLAESHEASQPKSYNSIEPLPCRTVRIKAFGTNFDVPRLTHPSITAGETDTNKQLELQHVLLWRKWTMEMSKPEMIDMYESFVREVCTRVLRMINPEIMPEKNCDPRERSEYIQVNEDIIDICEEVLAAVKILCQQMYQLSEGCIRTESEPETTVVVHGSDHLRSVVTQAFETYDTSLSRTWRKLNEKEYEILNQLTIYEMFSYIAEERMRDPLDLDYVVPEQRELQYLSGIC